MGSATEIVLAVEPGPDSPSGAVRVGGAPERRFDGWLSLLSMLQATIDELNVEKRSDGDPS
jgi:hypothetical protein